MDDSAIELLLESLNVVSDSFLCFRSIFKGSTVTVNWNTYEIFQFFWIHFYAFLKDDLLTWCYSSLSGRTWCCFWSVYHRRDCLVSCWPRIRRHRCIFFMRRQIQNLFQVESIKNSGTRSDSSGFWFVDFVQPHVVKS